MSIAGKIRFLMFVLGVCCIVTAISLNNYITKQDLRVHQASVLQKKLQIKEKMVKDFLTNPLKIKQLEDFYTNQSAALSFIKTFDSEEISLFIHKNNKLYFWSSSNISPPNFSSLKNGSTFMQLANGWYEIIKQSSGSYNIVFLIKVKNQFSLENQYLKNEFVKGFCPKNSLKLANFEDKDITEIYNINNEYLFAVKLNPLFTKNLYANLEVLLWLIGVFSICIFVNSFCVSLVKKGKLLSATAIITLFFILFRLSDLKYLWFNHHFDLAIFSPYIYSASTLLPSLGDLLLNTLAITWVGVFIYSKKDLYKLPVNLAKNKIASYLICLLMLAIICVAVFLFNDVFFGLIYNSKINFNITNTINLDWISWICILILCLVWFNLFLLATIFIQLTKQLNISNRNKVILFLTVFITYFIYQIINQFNVFFIVFALMLLLLGWNNYVQNKKFIIAVFAVTFFCMAFISAVKYLKFADIKEREDRGIIAEKLLTTEDPKIINAIQSFEKSVSSNPSIIKYFETLTQGNADELHNYISKKYLDGYLSKFEYKMYEYNPLDSALNAKENVPLNKYKDLVKFGTVKIFECNFFYKINDTFGFQSYFGIIPIYKNGLMLGSLVIELKSQQYNYNINFPELLIAGKIKADEDYSNYSFAFYKDNKLISQSGKYTYKVINKKFKGLLNQVNFINDEQEGYNHAMYLPNATKLIVISKDKIKFVVVLATLSFFFLVFILFSVIIYLLVWFIKNINNGRLILFSLNKHLLITSNQMLYKTRIQLSVVLSVVATLLIVGYTTFFYIKKEYLKQQEEVTKEKIRKLQFSFERQVLNAGGVKNDLQGQIDFNQFAELNAAYLNLYDLNGNLYLSSLPKIFELKILGEKMNPKAFIYLNKMQGSEFLNEEEIIGKFKYAAAYAPIRDAQNQTIAYINLPYYGNEADYDEKISLFVNTLINIYALVFVAIGVLAVFLANQITSPLTFVQESIMKTKIGQKNIPIVWHKQDEIGALIKEYNKMIAALELSANKLAQSERESAWREMAKQVAHEIKNPLTPLKLGLQLLEKSWKEKDVNFDKKFANYSKSFIEQIDSLATIASEFSNFAKMPDTKLEKLQLIPIIDKAISIFKNTNNLEIIINNQTNIPIIVLGDKDQLLRSFNNLLKNAIEAADDSVKCVIDIELNNNAENVQIIVKDNGKGINESLFDKIFVPNFTTKSSGTGLGLAFVKQAIVNANGTIAFNSEVNIGTTFLISLPLV